MVVISVFYNCWLLASKVTKNALPRGITKYTLEIFSCIAISFQNSPEFDIVKSLFFHKRKVHKNNQAE